jgi:hypothetical protein
MERLPKSTFFWRSSRRACSSGLRVVGMGGVYRDSINCQTEKVFFYLFSEAAIAVRGAGCGTGHTSLPYAMVRMGALFTHNPPKPAPEAVCAHSRGFGRVDDERGHTGIEESVGLMRPDPLFGFSFGLPQLHGTASVVGRFE